MWKVTSSKTAFKNKWWHINQEKVVLPSGKEIDYYLRDKHDATMVFPLTKDNNVVLIEQYRHGKRRVFTEFPAGLNEEGETPERTAERELQEETGYSGELVKLGELARDAGYSTGTLYLFLAKNAVKDKQTALEPTENIKVFTMPLVEFKKKLLKREINHGLGDSCLGFIALSYLGELK